MASTKENFPEKFPVPVVVSSETVEADSSVDYTTKEGFLALFKELIPVLKKDLNSNGYRLPKDAVEYIGKMMEYNVPKGKLTRGITVVNTFKALKPKASPEDVKRAAVLGWCIEWIQASFLVADDIMDNSITRRGQPCWYRNKSVGLIAINDALVLLTQSEVLLHKYFNHDSELFSALHACLVSTIYNTEMGQCIDMTTQPIDKTKVNYDDYTIERYDQIVKFKTAFYSFYAPVALGMIAAGYYQKEHLDVAETICMKMGRYFQIQDDYLDVFGDPAVLGKIGTDIQDAKCSWLMVQALQITTDDQKKILLENYGKDDENCIKVIKKLFNELRLEGRYQKFEEKIYNELLGDIAKCQNVPVVIFEQLLGKIYKRNK